ncbi:unnamed protein product [Penicillium camemberti]|uniref:Str. FM013 n=1 Tax=Penicillium camemberti (strain FM 013) TaxID=1429867 RepID=A0A0G4PM31_PENC3|nr:unnamed protein product [Penicillium camemberti]
MWVQGTGLPRATGASGVGLDSLQMAQSSLIGLSACVSILARSLTTWTPDPLVAVASTTRPQFFQIERPKKICDLLDPRKRGAWSFKLLENRIQNKIGNNASKEFCVWIYGSLDPLHTGRIIQHDERLEGVMFIGDANHILSPYEIVGANMAPKDRWDLAQQICRYPSMKAAAAS